MRHMPQVPVVSPEGTARSSILGRTFWRCTTCRVATAPGSWTGRLGVIKGEPIAKLFFGVSAAVFPAVYH